MPNCVRSIDGLELQVRAGVAERVGGRGDPGARGGDRVGDALDRQVARDLGGAVVGQVDVRGDEGDLRVVLGVEELVAQDVGAELLGRADRDRLDLGGALELAVGERRGDLVERAVEQARRPGN